ncbi:MAG TPA: efflux RND transporter periplasmic adaptor subunit [Bryobacteraceae bacterium]|nr:efflux RND transporter periplasmic adaptor subunit [Bryobacteraceae bacterium]
MDDKEILPGHVATAPEKNGGRRRALGRTAAVLTVLAVLLMIAITYGIHERKQAESNLRQNTNQAAIQEVRTVGPKQTAPTDEVVLPGATQPYINSPIYARASGYLVKWYHDIGSRVKKGDLLAVIDAPDLDKQLLQAHADAETSKANASLAKITADRWQGLIKTRSVSKQSTDQAVDNQKASQSSVNSYAANEARLTDLVSFEQICAPFDGVITARNTDNGWLIAAGQNSPNQELFQIGQISTLRVFVAVPEVYWRAARVGAKATLTLDEYPDQTFQGRIARTSKSIDMASRTLNTEVDIDNSRGLLLPGAYVQVHLALPRQSTSIIIPSDTLLFRAEGLRVGVVRNNVAQLVPIIVGTDYGETVQVVSGLTPTDQVIENPSDSLVSGMSVHITGRPGGANP